MGMDGDETEAVKSGRKHHFGTLYGLSLRLVVDDEDALGVEFV